MTKFSKHFEKIANAISLDAETCKYLKTDFGLIREYLKDIIRKDPLFGPILTDYIKNGVSISPSNFNCSFIFDFSRYVPLGALITKHPSFILLGQRGRSILAGIQNMPFFGKGNNMIGGIVTEIVRGLIEQGLSLSGYFVRGHMDDIYELELIDDDTQNLECNEKNNFAIEWQTKYIMLEAKTEGITLKIRLRVLIQFCSNIDPRDFMPYPLHHLKKNWLAAADVRYYEYFSLCAPLSERELAASPNNLMALRLLSALFAQSKIPYIRWAHLESVSFELIYIKSTKRGNNLKQSVASVIMEILQRLTIYLKKQHFPYFWDIKRNFLDSLKESGTKFYIQSCLINLLKKLKDMQQNENISYEDVEAFLGVQIDSQTYNVDDYGIYRSFTHS